MRGGLIAILAIAVFVLRLFVAEFGPLYLVPVALTGLWFGRWAGLGAGIVATGLYAIGEVAHPVTKDLGLLPATMVRLGVYAATGFLIGWFAESRARLEMALGSREQELAELRAIQTALSPPKPEPRPGLELATCYVAAEGGVAGDFYVVADAGNSDRTVIAIGDVAGRGIDAAKRAWFARTVLTSSAEFTEDPSHMLELANHSLIEEVGLSPRFVTAACLVVQPSQGQVAWSAAGHDPPVMLDRATPLGEELGNGLPLGVESRTGCETLTRAISMGDGLLLYTDGLTEARPSEPSEPGTLFGTERVTELVAQLRDEPPERIIDELRDAVVRFSGGRLADDLCMVALRLTDEAEAKDVCPPPGRTGNGHRPDSD